MKIIIENTDKIVELDVAGGEPVKMWNDAKARRTEGEV